MQCLQFHQQNYDVQWTAFSGARLRAEGNHFQHFTYIMYPHISSTLFLPILHMVLVFVFIYCIWKSAAKLIGFGLHTTLYSLINERNSSSSSSSSSSSIKFSQLSHTVTCT
jgi:hypothetical protein